MELPEDIAKTLEEKKLEFSFEPSKQQDWIICQLSRPSGFSLFREDIPRTAVKEWIASCITFIEGGKGWVK